MKRLLVLAAGLLQVPVIRKAREMGYYVIAADGDPEAFGLHYADKSVCADITSENDMLKIAVDERIDGVIHPCSEVSMTVMGRINDELHLHGISREVAVRATNKHCMRQAFEKYGVPSPLSFLTVTPEEAWSLFEEKFSKAILKPSRNSGSRGIAEVERGIGKDVFSRLYDRAFTESRDKSVLIEQFVEGPEFSVEIIVSKGMAYVLTVTDKKTTEAPYFVELGHNQPSLFPQDCVDSIQEAALAGVKALGLNDCAAHAEIKVEGGKAYIMEIGARLGGDFISTELTHLSTGIDMVAAAIDVALGNEPDLKPKEPKHGVCIRYFCPKPGRVVSIKHTDVLKSPDVYMAEIYRRVGETVPEVKSSNDRSGHVIVTAETAAEAVRLADEIIDKVKINTI